MNAQFDHLPSFVSASRSVVIGNEVDGYVGFVAVELDAAEEVGFGDAAQLFADDEWASWTLGAGIVGSVFSKSRSRPQKSPTLKR